jgi:hypothetical protein
MQHLENAAAPLTVNADVARRPRPPLTALRLSFGRVYPIIVVSLVSPT